MAATEGVKDDGVHEGHGHDTPLSSLLHPCGAVLVLGTNSI